jgi:hypothetical protein
MSLVLQSSGGGQITIQEPTTASNFTQTLPAATGTVMVSGNQPAFSAYGNANQSITTTTWTKVQLPVEDFDTNNCFDSTTNYRFTPTVDGYYQINGEIRSNGTLISLLGTAIYKNGVVVSQFVFPIPSSTNQYQVQVSKLIYLNGSTDYVELYGIVVGTSPSFDNGGGFAVSQFNGSLVRAA